MKKRLRSGFTTGSCAAAAAKAAALLLREGLQGKPSSPAEIEIAFPDGSLKSFAVHQSSLQGDVHLHAKASIIKDAGDDPDVTNGAEIVAEIWLTGDAHQDTAAESSGDDSIPCPSWIELANVRLGNGEGVGVVTKPGLAAKVGEPAINPIPRQMISGAVRDVFPDQPVSVLISVVNGVELATKTLNSRLGIAGGLSILGTTGIVRPISADAWTATIKASLDVAQEAGLSEVVLSTGRTSEKGAQLLLNLPEEAYAMMGDYLEFSLLEAAAHKFTVIHLAGMWAKIMKAALRIPQTHVRNGALEANHGAQLLAELGLQGSLLARCETANTAREIYGMLEEEGRKDLIEAVCLKAQDYCRDVTGKTVRVYLIDHRGEIIHHV